ncbi:hypothetical protein A3754_12550 [Alcanivorax sp. HI0083]|uniref:YkvA family protein n=1 Tax=unclassified Alcanivorax TaxID=2638842 RepID=UPI0007BA5D67|nr:MULTISPECIES: DUF1232 domain-containing protein [unclassified Alcanivorax]KZY36845.1 hypothetical protein A3730_01975 [Alcanivorax sp. HI0044]KZZ26063.1 hypothetical protein A3754_12550 [Alcanivorax sp. HI0083]
MPVNPFRVEARRRAGRILRSATATRWLVQAVFNRSDRFKARLGDTFADLILLASLLRDWVTGRYRTVPWGTLLTITGALVYFLMPLDAIPDPIVALGLLDDIAVISRTLKLTRTDLDRYQQWRNVQGEAGGENNE